MRNFHLPTAGGYCEAIRKRREVLFIVSLKTKALYQLSIGSLKTSFEGRGHQKRSAKALALLKGEQGWTEAKMLQLNMPTRIAPTQGHTVHMFAVKPM